MPTRIRVSELMTRDVAVARQELEVHELEQLFLARRIHGAPVVDESGRLIGMVSQTDLLAWHYDSGLDGADLPPAGSRRIPRGLHLANIRTAQAGEIMTPVVHAIGPESTAAEAALRMIRHRIHRLVVVDRELKVLGIISAMDLLPLIPGMRDLLAEEEGPASPRR